jgi:hypothetical protein
MNEDTFAASDYGAWLQAWYVFESRYHHKKSTPGFSGYNQAIYPRFGGLFRRSDAQRPFGPTNAKCITPNIPTFDK